MSDEALPTYTVTVSPTADGKREYLQIISNDGFATNIVLIGKFEIADTRDATGGE